MEIWEKFRDNLSKTLTEGKKQAVLLKEQVNDELQVSRIKKKLQAAKDDETSVLKSMGEKIYRKLNAGEDIIKEDFIPDFEYISGLKKRMADLENEINQIYEESQKRKIQEEKDAEIVLETQKDTDHKGE
jgi:hypothetical protein